MTIRTHPSIESFFPLAVHLARQLALRSDDVDDLIQEGLVALHLAFEKTPDILNYTAFATTVLRRKMRGYYNRREYEDLPDISIEKLQESIDDSSGNQIPISVFQHSKALQTTPEPVEDNLYLQAYLEAVETEIGKQARWIAENLISPSDEVGRVVLVEIEEKKQANRPVRGIETARVSQRLLWEALGISKPRWFQMKRRLQEFTAAWVAGH